eukprot:1090322-Pelagomonas_calceolata.AAC.4
MGVHWCTLMRVACLACFGCMLSKGIPLPGSSAKTKMLNVGGVARIETTPHALQIPITQVCVHKLVHHVDVIELVPAYRLHDVHDANDVLVPQVPQ